MSDTSWLEGFFEGCRLVSFSGRNGQPFGTKCQPVGTRWLTILDFFSRHRLQHRSRQRRSDSDDGVGVKLLFPRLAPDAIRAAIGARRVPFMEEGAVGPWNRRKVVGS